MDLDTADRTLVLHGAAYALAALAAFALADQVGRWLVRDWSDRRLLSAPVGLVVAAGAVAGLADAPGALDVGWDPAVGVALLAIVGAVVGVVTGRGPGSHPALGLATALVLGVSCSWLVVRGADLPGPGRVALAIAVVLLATLVSGFDVLDRSRRCAALLIAITCAGIYTTVPDTEQALVLVGAATPCVVLTWPLRTGRVGRAGAFALLGVVAWVAVTGGSGRPSSIVGALACTGMLAVEPLAGRLGRARLAHRAHHDLHRRTLPALVVIAAHVVLVGVGLRVAGMATSVATALVVATAVMVTATVALVLFSRPREWPAGRRTPPAPPVPAASAVQGGLVEARRTRAS